MRRVSCALLIAALCASGCGDDSDPKQPSGAGGTDASSAPEAGAGGTPDGAAGTPDGAAGAPQDQESALYVIESLRTAASSSETSMSYAILLDTLDRSAEVKLSSGREFPGYAPVDTIDGKIYVASGESPTITGYEIGAGSEWNELDEVSFANFTTASLEGNVLVDAARGVVALGDKNWVSYDPSEFKIGDLIELSSDVPGERDGLLVQRGYGHEIVGSRIYQPFYWSDAMFQTFSQESQIAVYDLDDAEFSNVIDAPCPHLHITTTDEDGNMYFSNGAFSVASAVLDAEHPRNCMVRVKAGATSIDEDFTIDFKDLTDGREGSNFFYIKDGLGFFMVYHAERDELGSDAAYGQVAYSPSYHLWTLDLKTMEAKIMDGIDYTGGQFVAYRLGERTFVTVPNADYSATAIYEVNADGAAEKKFDVQGWAFKMLKVR